MFGLVVSGRPISTDFLQVDQTHGVFSVPEAEKINHIVVFMTGQQAFPDGTCGAVYFGWAGVNGEPLSWQYLGYISNEKPSAIFKISKLLSMEQNSAPNVFASVNSSHFMEAHHNAFIGISVEATSVVETLIPDPYTVASSQDSFVEFVTKMLENYVNYVASFGQKQSDIAPNQTEAYVPLSVVQRWYEAFQRKLQLNPMFWKS